MQYLSTGTGITHSEMNDGPELCRFLQIWITPDKRGHPPQYGSRAFPAEARRNALLHVLGGTSSPPAWPGASQASPIQLHQDSNVFVSESDAGQRFELQLGAARQVYAICIEGAMDVNGTKMGARDAAAITGDDAAATPLTVSALEGGAHFMLIEMKKA